MEHCSSVHQHANMAASWLMELWHSGRVPTLMLSSRSVERPGVPPEYACFSVGLRHQLRGDEVYGRCRQIIRIITVELRRDAHSREGLPCARTDRPRLVQYPESAILRALDEIRGAKAVLIMQAAVPETPLSLRILKVVDEGNVLVEMGIVVVARHCMHHEPVRFEHSPGFSHEPNDLSGENVLEHAVGINHVNRAVWYPIELCRILRRVIPHICRHKQLIQSVGFDEAIEHLSHCAGWPMAQISDPTKVRLQLISLL